ncbi:MAG TPA: type II toxin-antitoxin system HicA family toxin [Acetobacteraceae bacterium]|nr:type II toxin-antitoxin system HicA family toxin [Acetobacteraceae bacterium]
MGSQCRTRHAVCSCLPDGLARRQAGRGLRALRRIGWTIKRQSGSHCTLARAGWPDHVFAFHDREEIGPRMLARIAKRTGLSAIRLLVRQLSEDSRNCALPSRRKRYPYCSIPGVCSVGTFRDI